MTDPSEEETIRQAQQGGREAFAGLVNRYWTPVYSWLFGLSRSTHTAEDLTQEVFMKAWRSIATYRPGTNFAAWLFRIAQNCFIDSRRQARSDHSPHGLDQVATREPGPLAATLHHERESLLEQACARLPVDLRGALLLRTQQNLSYAAIAEIMDATPETIRWRVFKARRLLLDELGSSVEGDTRADEMS